MNMVRRASQWLVLCVLVVSCRASEPTESVGARNARVVNLALRALQLDSLTVGTPKTSGAWHMVLNADTTELVVAHSIVALGLPDGPFEVLEPVTYFRVADSTWKQFAPVRGTDTLPAISQRALESQFSNRDYVYFYVVKRIAIDTNAASTDSSIVERIRMAMGSVEREAKRLKTAPFIGADAEP